METVTDIIFLGSKITADSDCSHEIKRCLLLGRKAMTNLDSVLKSRDITKVHLIKAVVFPVVMHGCESLTIKKAVVAVVVQSLSHVQLFVTSWTASHQASLSFTISQSLLKLMSIESAMPSNHLILCRPLLLPSSIFPSIRVFSNESVLRIRWPKYWSFSFSTTPSNEYSGLISFRMDWFDLLQNGLVGSPCSPRDSQESSPTPQFKSINASELSFLYSPTLTSIHDYLKNHSLD